MPSTLATLTPLAFPLQSRPAHDDGPAPELRYHRCPWCGSATGRAALLCPICGSPELIERTSSGTGIVHRLMTSRHGQFGEIETQCLVILDEGFTIQASLNDILPGTVPEGTRVRLAGPADSGHLPVFRACA
ncbi:putative OB-fold protein [Streptacidiphilus sp. MAP12-20]|uniref:Zn-ribbon domain-containing OB-fold protein n=1 Tax=Streptacidiphilus sp. MAP12-20 TaxID=3156299 RepID=UPI00351961E2